MKRVFLMLCVLAVALAIPSWAQLPAGEVVIRPSNLQGWVIASEGAPPASSGELEAGPGAPPAGGGSVRFVLADSSGGHVIGTGDPALIGLPLTQITKLEYCTYVTSAPGPQAVALQFNADNDVSDADTSWKGRLVFEPANTPGFTIVPNSWQCWNTLAGKWWGTGSPINGFAPISSPKTLAELLGQFPNLGFNSEFGGLLLKAGSGWSSFDGAADKLVIGINGVETTFNFEAEPGSKNDCKQGGWQDFGFKNQGQCIKYVNTGK